MKREDGGGAVVRKNKGGGSAEARPRPGLHQRPRRAFPDSTAQGSGLSNQRLLTADNAELFRTLYAPIKHLLADGKSICQTADKTKAKDYTLRKILQQVRREQGGGDAEAKGPKAA